jgi:hypothetical protein
LCTVLVLGVGRGRRGRRFAPGVRGLGTIAHLVIAVVNDGGHLTVFQRRDDTQAASVNARADRGARALK